MKISNRNILKKGSLWFSILIAIFAFSIAIASLQFSGKAGLVPLLVSVVVGALTIIAMISDAIPRLSKILTPGFFEVENLDKVLGKDTASKDEMQKTGEGRAVLQILFWCSGFFVLIYFIGFIPAIGLFAFLILRFYTKLSWLKSLVGDAIITGFVVVVFHFIFGFELFQGVLFGAIAPPL